MAAAASPAFLLCLSLLLLLSDWSRTRRADTHSLWYNFTIIHLPRPGQWWCEVQGQVDQKNFFSYDCGSHKVLSVGRLEEQLNATDAWERQLEMLREAGQRLRLELPGIELEDFTPSREWRRPRMEGSRLWAQGLHCVWGEDIRHGASMKPSSKDRAWRRQESQMRRGSEEEDVGQGREFVKTRADLFLIGAGPARLQARMSCECEADGHSKASWEFRCDGEKFLLFDSNSRKWTVVHAGARRMKEKWEEDRVLTNLFRRVSIGDCRIWLREFLMHREKRLEPTGDYRGALGAPGDAVKLQPCLSVSVVRAGVWV
uniref:MHC class I-like antigen recognition-like domain-containing protein n=1 Tax=Callithrix jacchus TaxID=9483 RepID=A0A8I3W8F0_CALJA